MEEKKLKAILEKKITLLGELEGQIKRQIKAIEESDEPALIQALEAKENVIALLVKDDEEFDKYIAHLDDKNRKIIAKKLKEFGVRIETETEKIIEMENTFMQMVEAHLESKRWKPIKNFIKHNFYL